MKILSIRGKNLASLENAFELDFTVEPLKSAGIFAITGNTGSGKSTILDALCLALFDNTPRISQANEQKVAIVDVGGQSINQSDVRTILRRGATESFAEADFVALDGQTYRSRWSVQRSKGLADGALKNTVISLQNLAAASPVSGTKTELLRKIVELIGMTFEQFTRAVLLAQGDFALFLKAKQNDRAELLEKLTGTEIYSEISKKIYEKAKDVEYDYQKLFTESKRIEEQLLTAQQMEEFSSEKTAIAEEMAAQKTQLENCAVKLKWLDSYQEVCKNIAQAEQALAAAANDIASAKPRYDKVAQIESVQEIRDPFNQYIISSKQLNDNQLNYQQQTIEYEKVAADLKQYSEKNSHIAQEKQTLNSVWEKTEPEIVSARAIDEQLKSAKTTAEEAAKEHLAAELSKQRMAQNMQTMAQEVEKLEVTIESHRKWLVEHEQYKDIASKADFIVETLDSARNNKVQHHMNRKLQKDNEEMLESEQKRLSELNEKMEKLKGLLPAEIAALRAQLQEGKPCPVCGSVHHQVQGADGAESLQEAELTRAKQSITDEIALLAAAVEKRKVEISRLSALTETYARQLAEELGKVEVFLTKIPSWQSEWEQSSSPTFPERVGENRLTKKLKTIAHQWKSFTDELNNAEALLTGKKEALANESMHLAEISKTGEQTALKKENTAAILSDLQAKRAHLLHGQPANEVAAQLTAQKKAMEEKLQQSTAKMNELALRQEQLKTITTHLTQEIKGLNAQCAALQQTIEQWIAKRNDGVTGKLLKELFSKDQKWMDEEKKYLNGLKEVATAAKATLEERKRNLAQHQEAAVKPQEGETRETLNVQHSTTEAALAVKNQRLTEIELLFIQHRQNCEQLKTLEQNLREKETLSANWAKLNEVFGSKEGGKFQKIAQQYTLDILLSYANKHLHDLSKRYEVQRIPDTLALQVVDLDMLGEKRTVYSLSGGESFLVSLALSLGLSSLSSNKLHIESLFIDEGFGSLDADTFRVAMDALEQLQTQGRKIGVISHVAEMTERIAVQVRVTKTNNGKSIVNY
ncbi:MAG: AAA family ATPase [Bacteroidales bacterium]|jgi:exonuclease SbcC|nr:AAA family ATPase [Bacteroidales bacterium]